jgi:hypothetical protein
VNLSGAGVEKATYFLNRSHFVVLVSNRRFWGQEY